MLGARHWLSRLTFLLPRTLINAPPAVAQLPDSLLGYDAQHRRLYSPERSKLLSLVDPCKRAPLLIYKYVVISPLSLLPNSKKHSAGREAV